MKHARNDYERIQDPAGLIPADEPVFLLRGQDAAASDTLLYWAKKNEAIGGDRHLSQLAREQAARMDAWPKKKKADRPKSIPQSRTSHCDSETAEPKTPDVSEHQAEFERKRKARLEAKDCPACQARPTLWIETEPPIPTNPCKKHLDAGPHGTVEAYKTRWKEWRNRPWPDRVSEPCPCDSGATWEKCCGDPRNEECTS